jgi:putative transposase
VLSASATLRSHLILRTYKFRIYPNAEQRELLAKHFGCCRFAYNHFLEERKKAYETEKKTLSLYETHHMIAMMRQSEEYKWLNEVYGHSLQYSLRCIDGAYKKFFKQQGGFPKFHSKRDKQSCTFPDNVKIVDGKLKLMKFKTPIAMKMHREVIGVVKRATVSMTPTHKYYASILVAEDCPIYDATQSEVGIDVGIKEMAVCSNGERVANPKYLETSEKHLKHLQREVSRKKKGSNGRRRARQRLSRFHEKVANRRKDYIHKFTSRIVRDNQTVCVEDLNVKGMESNHHLAKSVASVSFGEIARQLEYKCRWHGRTFVKAERFYPSSKTCNHCGAVNNKLALADREWVCPSCGEVIDRDYNAALNILKRGKEILSGCGKQSDDKQKGVEALQLCESAKH